jgi:hypothetical protein
VDFRPEQMRPAVAGQPPNQSNFAVQHKFDKPPAIPRRSIGIAYICIAAMRGRRAG